jgi:transposase InsO family protein
LPGQGDRQNDDNRYSLSGVEVVPPSRFSVEALYVEPGSPWENGYAESFHSRVRDEFLAIEEFENLPAARKLTATWKDAYNHRRPHSSLGYATPVEYAAKMAGPC